RPPLVMRSRPRASSRCLPESAAPRGVTLEPEIELASVALLIAFAKAGLGISFVTRQFAQDELDAGNLVEVKVKEPIPSRKAGIVFLKNRRLSPATGTFLKSYLKLL